MKSHLIIAESLAAVVLLASYGPSIGASQSSAIWWTPAAKLSTLDDIGHRLHSPELDGHAIRMERSDGASRAAATCSEYLEGINQGFAIDAASREFEPMFIRDCYLLNDLSLAAEPVTSYIRDSWSPDTLREMPRLLQWGPEVYGYQSPDRSWSSLVPDARVTNITANEVDVEDADSRYALVIVGRADFNHDGFGDIAVLGSVHAKVSTYSETQYYVLTRCGQGQLLRLIEAPLSFRVAGTRCP